MMGLCRCSSLLQCLRAERLHDPFRVDGQEQPGVPARGLLGGLAAPQLVIRIFQ